MTRIWRLTHCLVTPRFDVGLPRISLLSFPELLRFKGFAFEKTIFRANWVATFEGKGLRYADYRLAGHETDPVTGERIYRFQATQLRRVGVSRRDICFSLPAVMNESLIDREVVLSKSLEFVVSIAAKCRSTFNEACPEDAALFRAERLPQFCIDREAATELLRLVPDRQPELLSDWHDDRSFLTSVDIDSELRDPDSWIA